MSYGKPKWVDDLKLKGTKETKEHKSNNKVTQLYTKARKPILSEKDFYPPEDKRYLKSGVEDIKGGDSFADYVEYYFDSYSEDG